MIIAEELGLAREAARVEKKKDGLDFKFRRLSSHFLEHHKS